MGASWSAATLQSASSACCGQRSLHMLMRNDKTGQSVPEWQMSNPQPCERVSLGMAAAGKLSMLPVLSRSTVCLPLHTSSPRQQEQSEHCLACTWTPPAMHHLNSNCRSRMHSKKIHVTVPHAANDRTPTQAKGPDKGLRCCCRQKLYVNAVLCIAAEMG